MEKVLDPESQLDAADLARKQGDFETACCIYEQALLRDSGCTRAAAGMGICLQRMGRRSAALQYLASVASAGCDDPDLFVSLGSCYFGLGKWDVAANAFRRAIGLNQTAAQPRVSLAHCLIKMGESAEAEENLRQAIELDPNLASAHDLMSFLLPEIGRFDEAKEFARRASQIEPDNPAYAVRYVYGGKVTLDDLAFVERLEAMARSKDISAANRIRVEYGLGKAMEDLERFQESLGHYLRANSLAGKEMRSHGQGFNSDEHVREVDYLIDAFSKNELKRRAPHGSESELPVFIVGMMRSGTTLTEQILSSHPQVGGAGELDFWIKEGPRSLQASSSAIRATTEEYLRLLERTCPEKARVCDKMPQNYMSLGPIHSALPNARIIHCRRDARDTCLSIFTVPFAFHPPFAYSFKNLAGAYRQYQRLMDHWRQALPPNRLLEVDYEELVADQEGVTRRMIQFLGLEWSDLCLQPQNNNRLVTTPSRWQVRQPVYKKSVSRWKRFEPWLRQVEDWRYVDEL
ncbi:MAG TPA: sulfotransferase [Fimbriimonas sp.]|nr:sulfotransferase [Fimbriimonas sp.]